ncbi:MAG TPA: accessory Sec system translocase SecA2 [Candidatus Angelobacter sp.]|nr:accessory Sec system translocase SecA2 [Candidatus Angelobacter sp.]
MHRLFRALFGVRSSLQSAIGRINKIRADLVSLNDNELRHFAQSSTGRLETMAAAAVVAHRLLGLEMFDVQLHGALAMTEGRIAEMQTGEGKTLAAVPAVACYARAGKGVHVMTVNDYLARRDAQWMGGIYEFFGFSVGYIQREMSTDERKRAYSSDITYATANEVGFDYLRDQLALHPAEQVHRPFAVALIDEADSILIDEARIPLIIAGGHGDLETLPYRVDRVTRQFQKFADYTLDEHGRNVALTDAGIHAVERAFRCGNLFAEKNLSLLTAIQDSIHAHALLRRDVDYLVKDGSIESVDEFKGRVVQDRRWPAGLHSAIEAKEGVALKKQGEVLGSVTLQNLVALYPNVCGMTGTAATQARELREIYGLAVEVVPTNRPVIRVDHPDVIFRTRQEKEDAVIKEITASHETRQPILVGTTSVEESERLSRRLQSQGVRHQVLNARHEDQEAAIVARAGELNAVTISTNMAGRGTDIKLGEGVAALGGLYVIGANRHESRRIDNQLRGRAGRQGDPGSSRFFISLEDDLLVRYGIDDPLFRQEPDSIQRVVEGQNLEIRRFLHKYESVIEGQRLEIQRHRQDILTGAMPCSSESEKLVRLTTIDDLWAEYLAAIAELRSGIHWVSFGGRDPLHEYLTAVHQMFQELELKIEEETAKRLAEADANGVKYKERGATWTYLTTDQPFGSQSERFLRGMMKKMLKSSS